MPINQTIIEGNLTRDGELRQARSGIAVLNFTVAHNRREKNKQTGEWEDAEPSYFRCVMFGRQAEALYQNGYFTKGRRILVQGTLRQRNYTTQQGEEKTTYEIVVEEVFFGSVPNRTAPQQQETYQQPEVYDEDLPF